MLSRRAKVGIALYILACGWVVYRTMAGYPTVAGNLLQRISG
jgi:hypothetical protein